MADSWNLESIVEYFKEDPEVAAELTSDDWDRLSNPDEKFVKLLREALQYQGFDPKTILRELVRRNKAYKTENESPKYWDLTNTSGDFKCTPSSSAGNKYSDHESVTKDAQLLIFTFLLRCNHISKVIQKSLPGIQEILEMLKLKYNINDEVRASGTTLCGTDITLPRIAGTMPAVAVRLFHTKSVKETVQFLSIPGIQYEETVTGTSESAATTGTTVKTRNVSHAICCPFLLSLHPMTSFAPQNIHALMLYVAVKLDDIIHKKEKNFTNLEDLLTYYKASFQSPATPERARVDVFHKIGLTGADKKTLVDDIKAVNASCCEALIHMRVDDEYHSTFLSVARTGNMID